jgi:hypothetical protein
MWAKGWFKLFLIVNHKVLIFKKLNFQYKINKYPYIGLFILLAPNGPDQNHPYYFRGQAEQEMWEKDNVNTDSFSLCQPRD